MKHSGFYRTTIAIAMILIGWLPSLAHDFEVNGIYYNITGDNEVEVTYRGSSYDNYDNEYISNTVITSSVHYNGVTYSITSIGDYAFQECSSLTSITIPNSVTSIGDYAFASCSSLTDITIPNSVTSIGSFAFRSTGWYNNQPDGILYLDNYCLGYKTKKPSGNLSLKAETRLIAGSAFSGCSNLKSITIPNYVTSIGDYAFQECSSLTSITIPNSVTSIGNFAFRYCSDLTDITIPYSVASIGSEAFHYTDWYDNQPQGILYLDNCCLGYKDSKPSGNLSLKAETRLIAGYAFRGCSNLKSITIPNYVTSIDYATFASCSSLTSITIPNSVTSIGDYAFKGCSGLKSITIPNSITSIGDCTFQECRSLTSITIPNNVTSIGDYAFDNCTNLTSVTIPNNVTSIGNYAFESCI